MKTMSLIDQFGFTMQHYGMMLAEAAEHHELGQWAESHRAAQKAEEYRVQAQSLRKQIQTACFPKTNETLKVA